MPTRPRNFSLRFNKTKPATQAKIWFMVSGHIDFFRFSFPRMSLFVDEEVKSGNPGQYIPKAEMMYLGGIPAGFELIQPDGFSPDILNSLKGGSIKYLTSKGKYVFDCVITISIMQTNQY